MFFESKTGQILLQKPLLPRKLGAIMMLRFEGGKIYVFWTIGAKTIAAIRTLLPVLLVLLDVRLFFIVRQLIPKLSQHLSRGTSTTGANSRDLAGKVAMAKNHSQSTVAVFICLYPTWYPLRCVLFLQSTNPPHWAHSQCLKNNPGAKKCRLLAFFIARGSLQQAFCEMDSYKNGNAWVHFKISILSSCANKTRNLLNWTVRCVHCSSSRIPPEIRRRLKTWMSNWKCAPSEKYNSGFPFFSRVTRPEQIHDILVKNKKK